MVVCCNEAEAKIESLQKARELFPAQMEHLTLKKHHDRAEALLLAFTVLAETQGCVIDRKYQKLRDLANIYLTHKQDGDDKAVAKFTDIYMAELMLNKTHPLLQEINKRKANA
jgi:hypothetical protein